LCVLPIEPTTATNRDQNTHARGRKTQMRSSIARNPSTNRICLTFVVAVAVFKLFLDADAPFFVVPFAVVVVPFLFAFFALFAIVFVTGSSSNCFHANQVLATVRINP